MCKVGVSTHNLQGNLLNFSMHAMMLHDITLICDTKDEVEQFHSVFRFYF